WALHVSQSLSDGLHAALALTLDEARVTTHPFRPLGVYLLLRRIVLTPFFFELLAICVAQLSRFQVVISNRLVALALDVAILGSNLVAPISDLLLCPLSTPLSYLFCIGWHLIFTR